MLTQFVTCRQAKPDQGIVSLLGLKSRTIPDIFDFWKTVCTLCIKVDERNRNK